jgi:hypothetical protein
MTFSPRRFLFLLPAGLALAALSLSGCEQEAITTYTVPRPAVRLLGVMVPRPDYIWFFKLAGPVEAVTENEKDFDEFIASVRFSDDKEKVPVTWTVPEAWTKVPSRESMRFATFRGRQGSEVIVTPLEERKAGDVLSNVNRWRRQLGLPEVEEAQLKDITKTITVGGVKTATRVDCTGIGGQITKAPPPRVRPDLPPNQHAVAPARQLDYKAPPEWHAATTQMEQIASFTVGEGGESVKITVTPMGGGAGGEVANVNRWRGQVGLPEMSATQIEADGTTIKIGDRSALLLDLKGKDSRIVGAICETGGRTWFFKMTGPGHAVEKQKSAFDQFLASVRFGGGDEQ